MKKYSFPIIVTILISLCSISLTMSGAKESENYIVPGHHTNGTIITNDGNIWDCQTEMLNGAVHVVFNDNGTPDNIYDDIIIDLIKAK